MIESNIMKYIDINDSVQILTVYNKKFLIKLFKMFEILKSFKVNNILFQIILKILFFLQIFELALINISNEEEKEDYLIKLIKSVKSLLLLTNNINSKSKFLLFSIGSIIYCSLIFICFLYVIYLVLKKPLNHKIFPIQLLSILNVSLLHYGLCQVININLLITKCKTNEENKLIHEYLKKECYKNSIHLILLIFNLSLLFFVFVYSFLLAIYYYEIGSLKNEPTVIRINCYYELFENSISCVFYILTYIIKEHTDSSKKKHIYFFQIVICFFSLLILIYIYKCVYFYEEIFNYLIYFGWSATAWFTFSILLKNILDIENSLIFFIVGIIIIFTALYFIEKLRIDYCLTNANIFDLDNIKQLETFTSTIIKIANEKKKDSDIILGGIIQSIQENINNNPKLNQNSLNFITNKFMIKKFKTKDKDIFNLYNILFILYDYYLDKAEFGQNILFILCLFLVNKLKNPTYAFYLCAKKKTTKHKEMFIKYILIEKLKRYFFNKLTQTNKIETKLQLAVSSCQLAVSGRG